jgi:DNA-directed RNA polymerase sigma subunit (sigma70/sigma32)
MIEEKDSLESTSLYEYHSKLIHKKHFLVKSLLDKMKELVALEKAIEDVNIEAFKVGTRLAKECYGLSTREQEFYLYRFIESDKGYTLDEIAEIMHLSRNHIGRLSMQVGRKIQRNND